MGVVTVRDAVNGVVGPVQGAGLDGGLETGENFKIRGFTITAAGVAGAAVNRRIVPRTLVGLKWFERKRLIRFIQRGCYVVLGPVLSMIQ